jgi:hypothetical protein
VDKNTKKEKPQDNQYLFNHAQDLGPPSVFPPLAQGKIPASVQFITPNLKLGKSDKKNIDQLARKCGADLWAVDTHTVENRRTKVPATLFTLAFYIPPAASEEQNREAVELTSRLLVERFLGLFSFFVGGRLSAAHTQATISKEGHYQKYFTTIERSSMPPDKGEFLSNLKDIAPSEDIWSALVWLRRGLAERDPIETFSSLMVSLQIMARHLVKKQPVTQHCPSCGAELETQEPSITSLMRELIVSRLGATPKLFDRLWKSRNAIVAHGNRPITPEVFIELTELKFDAAVLAFQSIKLGLGIPKDSPPSPNQAFFVTDAFMYVD